MSEDTITVYLLTEDRISIGGKKEITGCCIDPILAETILCDSFFGSMKVVQAPREQWEAIQKQLQSLQESDQATDVTF